MLVNDGVEGQTITPARGEVFDLDAAVAWRGREKGMRVRDTVNDAGFWSSRSTAGVEDGGHGTGRSGLPAVLRWHQRKSASLWLFESSPSISTSAIWRRMGE